MTMIQSTPIELTPRHARAARALLAWSQQDLAKAASVGTSTIADFERGQRTPVANNAQAIRRALEDAGIRFLAAGAVIGPPVPAIAGSDRAAMPVRWINADQLVSWADLAEAVLSLPTLVAHLIRASHGTEARLCFPAAGSVWHEGWDGRSEVEIESPYVPKGTAGWEIGTQRGGIASKANEDYRKRTDDPDVLDPEQSAFIFVTPRRWKQKDAWVKARQAEGIWREVRAYDVDDLVHWIELAPAVGLWLLARLGNQPGNRPESIRLLEEAWQEWSLATRWPLTEDLVLSDRDEDAAAVLRWLRAEPAALALQATTAEEAVCFFHATLAELPDDIAAAYRARCLVVDDATAARGMAQALAPLILVLTEPDPGLAASLVQRGHYVLQTYDERPLSRGDARMLARPSREGIASALVDSGLPGPRADALARDSARNLAVLRRLMPAAPGRLPAWAVDTPPPALLAALLAGGWDDDAEADRARVSELAQQPYEGVIVALAPYVGNFDSPLQKVGSTWKIASLNDAWFLLAHYLTGAHVARFEAVAKTVLGAADPRFDMAPDDRWLAAIRGIHPEHSGMLRHGIGQVLILLALWGDRITTFADAPQRADAIVAGLLRDAEARLWWSLSSDFRLLAEASPDAFLNAIEDSLDKNDPPIAALFGHDEGGLFGAEHLSDLMWALESLAWSPRLMPRVTHALARLDAIDIKPRRYSNGPANSLREIHLLWMPQTYATLDERLRALDLVRKREPEAAWKLGLGILPQGHGISHPSPMPFWRDFTIDEVETVTYGLVGRGAAEVSDRLLADVGLSAERWSLLLDRLADLAPGPDAAIAALTAAEPKITDSAQRAALWTKLRELLHHHRQFPDADWSLPTLALDRLEGLYGHFAPGGRIEQSAWLFGFSVSLPKPRAEDWDREDEDIDAARRDAAGAILAEGGIPAILALARLSEAAGFIGKALFERGLPAGQIDALLKAALRSGDTKERDVGHGLIVAMYSERQQAWAGRLIGAAKEGGWGETALMTILRALPCERWVWDEVACLGETFEGEYWRRAPVYWIGEDDHELIHAIRMLVAVGRASHALSLVVRGTKKKVNLPTALLVELLDAATRQPPSDDAGGNEMTMFQYNVAETFKLLDERADADRDALARLEWNYLRILEHSRRPAKVLLEVLAEQPLLFVEMVSAVFKPSEESGIVEPAPENPEQAKSVATQAYRLLELWDRIPGTGEGGAIDAERLESWMKEARSLAKDAGRTDIADSRIGAMLSASPLGADGNWPAEPVREMLDLFRSTAMLDGFVVGKRNRRGVTSRMPREGGRLERGEATKYRQWAEALAYDHPRTAKALDDLAEAYEREAQRHDEDAARLDWEH